MNTVKNQGSSLKKLTGDAIDQRLGDISGLPEEMKKAIWKGYREFISGYLNMIRRINRHLDRLRKMDGDRQSRLYQEAVADFLAGADRPGIPEETLAKAD
jgi:hypothetical protein